MLLIIQEYYQYRGVEECDWDEERHRVQIGRVCVVIKREMERGDEKVYVL